MKTKKVADRKIKVHVSLPDGSKEYIWARRIGQNTAKIENIPYLAPGIGLGDLVRISPSRKILKVLEHVAESQLLRYADADKLSLQEVGQRYFEVRAALQEYDILTEGMFPGTCSISVPLDISDEQLLAIAETIGIEVIGLDAEDRDD